MKLATGLIAAFASGLAAAQQAAQVYMLPRPDASTPTISRSLARLVLLQRLAPSGKGPSYSELPDGTDPEDFVSLMNQLGKAPAPLFTDGEATSPRQLVVMLEGMTERQISDMGDALDMSPAFAISNPPSGAAHEQLAHVDFFNLGVTNNECSLLDLANPSQEGCWSGKSAVKRLNVQKDSQTMDEFLQRFAGLQKLANAQEIETTIVLLPNVAETSTTKYWSDKPQELRRRQEAEQVMSIVDDESAPAAPTSDATSNPIFYKSSENLPSCFNSADNCMTSTGNCSSHGSCQNKYAKTDGSEGQEVCYQCYCLSTANEKSGSRTHWAGATCSKQDVSVAFWLFAGFTLVMVSVLWMSIAMLFNVGEEKLPGVIGAGVSRSK